ncbi:MAG: DoxX family protein [Proteobacteria bacterium]|nr:DoxX family protein [Pseudomonadota bacterium]MBS0269314.1 DoxX family protein [Pseudomonadota bacterium]
MKLVQLANTFLEKSKNFDFLALLAIRLYLLPIFYVGAHAKITGFQGTVEWFATPVAQGGLGMPAPVLMAFLATATEAAGLVCLAIGLLTRLISVPLMFTMIVASLTVHWSHGWAAIAGKTAESAIRMQGFMDWLAQNFPGRFNYITELGDPVILNNGIEFSATYVIMLAVLFFYGGGRYVSVDYWLSRWTPMRELQPA